MCSSSAARTSSLRVRTPVECCFPFLETGSFAVVCVADVAYGTMTLDSIAGPITIPAVRRRLSKAALWREFCEQEGSDERELPLGRTTFYSILQSLSKHTQAETGVDTARIEFNEAIQTLLAFIDSLCAGERP